MASKHFLNDADKLVLDCLECLTLSNPTLKFLKSEKAIILANHAKDKHVNLISGGGAGHEPAHAAYVGTNMLSAAVSGSIFASPSVSQIYNTIKQSGGDAGTLLIVKNYTGDVFNFNIAASKGSAAGKTTKVVIVGDDVSVGREKSGKVGRRGLAGTVFVHKIAGGYAASEEGPELDKVQAMAQSVADNLVTVGASLDRVHVPGRSGEASFLAEDELELGMGIHNEPGCRRMSPVPSLESLVEEMLGMLLSQDDKDRAYVPISSKDNVVLMVNNLGGTSVLELGGVAMEVFRQLESTYQIVPARSYIGTYMTSLDGPGFSITLLKATEEMLTHLDTSVEAAGWSPGNVPSFNASKPVVARKDRVIESATGDGDDAEIPASNLELDLSTFKSAVERGCSKVIAAEPKLTQYDDVVGDGDCGTTFKRGAQAISKYISTLTAPTTDAVRTTHALAAEIENSMDGTSGAIFSIYLNSLVSGLRSTSPPTKAKATAETWSSACTSALAALQKVTPARPGDRTLMDALTPFVETLAATLDLEAAAQAGRRGAEGTQGMAASLGRSVYVDAANYGKVPDPGAVGLAEFFEGLAEGLR